MKKVYTLIIALLIAGSAMAQTDDPCESCLPYGITFETQAQIDSFQIIYPNCTEIEGYVWIAEEDISNLNGLGVLTYIGEFLRISSTSALSSLAGLGNLDSIGGYLEMYRNNTLTNLSGLDSLSSIGGDLIIDENESLTSFNGIGNMTSIGGMVRIYQNYALTSLSGLENIDPASIGNLRISHNPLLSACSVQSICNYLLAPNGIVDIYDNAAGCNSPPEIANGCGITLACLPYGNYHFYYQNEIDNFTINYPNCTALGGSVFISGTDINNLNGLSALTSVGLSLNIYENDALTSLTGLENLDSVGGLSIGTDFWGWAQGGNPNLTSISSLGNLDFIGYDLQIYNNPALVDLTGLENVNSTGGDILITLNSSLTSLTGLENLDSIGGSLNIGSSLPYSGGSGNASLSSISALDNLDFIGYDLQISNNSTLLNLAGLENVSFIQGNLGIGLNDSLTSLVGLDNVSFIQGSLFIKNNEALASLGGLENVDSISEWLEIWSCPALTDFSGLTSLTSIGGLHVLGNASLTSLSGLEGLTAINGGVGIQYNDSLSSLSGLDNIKADLIEDLYITQNPYLSHCAVLSICNYLNNPGGSVNIDNNTVGCDSPEEVQDSCEANGVNVDEQFIAGKLDIYPNPTHSTITIELLSQPSKNTTLTISNTNGQQLISQSITEPQTEIDIRHLPTGIYIVKVWNDKEVMVQKVIKQ